MTDGSRPDRPSSTTRVHLVRHGEVDNPGKVLYGRLPGYHLSDARAGRWPTGSRSAPPTTTSPYVVASPLERAQETAAPIAAAARPRRSTPTSG